MSNAANEELVREAAKKEKRGRDLEIDDMSFILSHKGGRRFMWRLLCECGVFKLSADNSGSWTYFNEGRRNVGLKLLNDINETSPESYFLMLKESKEQF